MKLENALEITDFRTVLERGDIPFFPDGGFEIPAAVRTALMGASQDARSIHKNIAYKPNSGKVSGLVDRTEYARVQPAMRDYSNCALEFMKGILPDYARAWKIDYASFRSIEEQGRELPLTKRNDLLHIDAFPTRPVFGDLILRCFTNVNPEQSRQWPDFRPVQQTGGGGIHQSGAHLVRQGGRLLAAQPRQGFQEANGQCGNSDRRPVAL